MPVTREARCTCGDLTLTLESEPMLTSACCCKRCQRRTGSLFGVTVYFHPDQLVRREGASSTFQRSAGAATFHFCPRCGSSVLWSFEGEGDIIGVAGGAFADPALPGPHRMTHTATGHPFVTSPRGIPTYEGPPPP